MIQVIVIIFTGWLTGKIKSKGWVIVGVSLLPIIGTILMLTVDRKNQGALLFGYYLVGP